MPLEQRYFGCLDIFYSLQTWNNWNVFVFPFFFFIYKSTFTVFLLPVRNMVLTEIYFYRAYKYWVKAVKTVGDKLHLHLSKSDWISFVGVKKHVSDLNLLNKISCVPLFVLSLSLAHGVLILATSNILSTEITNAPFTNSCIKCFV